MKESKKWKKLFKTTPTAPRHWKKSSTINDQIVTRLLLVTKKNLKRIQVDSMTTKEDGYEKYSKQVDLPANSRDQDSQEEPWKEIPRRIFHPRYEPIFYGKCYSCGSFGHSVIECRTYVWNKYSFERYFRN